MKIYTPIALLCCLALTLTLPGCIEITELKLRVIKTRSDTSVTGQESEKGKSAESALTLKEVHAGFPGRRIDPETPTATSIGLEARSQGGEIWTLKVAECKLLALSYVNEDKNAFSVTDESAPFEAISASIKLDDLEGKKLEIRPQENLEFSLSFITKDYDFCILALPFVSETGENLVFELLYSAKRLPRKTVDQFKSGLGHSTEVQKK